MSYHHGQQSHRILRCYESHPPLKLGGHQIYGGSCSHPIIHDADVYVGFDSSMKSSPLALPWNEGESFLFRITDALAPSNPTEFAALIDWLAVQLIANKKIHLGCIGGHGRTGTVLAALTKVMLGEVDAITYVRDNYCKKAVESEAQVDFLVKHFGIKKVNGAKNFGGDDDSYEKWCSPKPQVKQKAIYSPSSRPPDAFNSLGGVTPIWGPEVKITI